MQGEYAFNKICYGGGISLSVTTKTDKNKKKRLKKEEEGKTKHA